MRKGKLHPGIEHKFDTIGDEKIVFDDSCASE